MRYDKIITDLREQGNLRSIPQDSNNAVVDFSLNDYLGIAESGIVQQEFFSNPANTRIALTSSASRLLASDQKHYTNLENHIAAALGREVLLFNSGYHANTGMVSALADASTLIVADNLVHASIIDGIMLSKAPFTRFRHNDIAHLDRILEKESGKYERVIVIVESVYSMDGDSAPLEQIAELKGKYGNMMLYVDEAHSFGVLGRNGMGVTTLLPHPEMVDVVIGTFGKALGSAGAFAAMNSELRTLAINRARSFIFSTALPPMSCAYTLHTLKWVENHEDARTHLGILAAYLRDALKANGIKTSDDARYITPIVIGDAKRTVEISRKLLEHGVKVLPIRTPTVPPGTERLRISLSAAMSHTDIDLLVNSLVKVL
ncbi:MAG: 8-amino-7-oxononanoate synthase [Muribaculaceae bacterium]|nr:8-amino-7-oxononanoate synthase [Muribaculaceae bacterium]